MTFLKPVKMKKSMLTFVGNILLLSNLILILLIMTWILALMMVTQLVFFCSPLFFFLQALVDISIVNGDRQLVNDAVLYIFSIFQAIRKTEDSVDSHATIVKHFQHVP
jgi:hypothetical protein